MVVVGKEQMYCELQAICMPVEVVGKEQRIANCRQFICQLKL
jgi:hypothetical protein